MCFFCLSTVWSEVWDSVSHCSASGLQEAGVGGQARWAHSPLKGLEFVLWAEGMWRLEVGQWPDDSLLHVAGPLPKSYDSASLLSARTQKLRNTVSAVARWYSGCLSFPTYYSAFQQKLLRSELILKWLRVSSNTGEVVRVSIPKAI